ncbi:unnamed protein product [Menidia menidia]|uniref:(Atlantic silverside) hypothetical protein n=1 Tax=Menidia menidia TaxID=238744 RepID=A0A8S4AN05_9TELE|nr:unnamed protein product [Menidia menidia]
MDYHFPRQLFPSFFNHGPPDYVLNHRAGGWGCYDGVIPQDGSAPPPSWKFTSRHQVSGETWCPTEPAPVPLLTPKSAFLGPLKPPDPLDFVEQMQNFFTDHYLDAFGSMSEILGEHFFFRFGKKKEVHRRHSVNMWRVRNHLDLLKLNVCQSTYTSPVMDGYCGLLSGVVPDVPVELLGSLLHGELAEQSERARPCHAPAGGALAFIPRPQDAQHGCLLYAQGRGLDRLCILLTAPRSKDSQVCSVSSRSLTQASQTSPGWRCSSPGGGGGSACLEGGRRPVSFQLTAPVRQISHSSLGSECCVAVRSDRLCGAWRLSGGGRPRLLQALRSRELASCVCVSPHVLGEVLVASESGAASLWTVGKGTQRVRTEPGNLYFNAKSPWRWCEFSAHPRVMLYADRTGAELTDMRASSSTPHTLFSISRTSECQRGERLVLCRYLGDAHPFHHLIFTQITLLQYSGGRLEACVGRGPPLALLRPKDSLPHLPVQIPHRRDRAASRLSAPAAGLTCIQSKAGRGSSQEESICVLQLTEAGDLFYQLLQRPDLDLERDLDLDLDRDQDRDRPRPAAAASDDQPGQSPEGPDAWSDQDVVGPTQAASVQVVAETPERERPEQGPDLPPPSPWDRDDSGSDGVRRPEAAVEDGGGAAGGMDGGMDGGVPGGEEAGRRRLSRGAAATWKLWLQMLAQRSSRGEPRPRRFPLFRVASRGLLSPPDGGGGAAPDGQRWARLSWGLKSSMARRSLLLHSAAAAWLEPPGAPPPPPHVPTDTWSDPLSQRLALAWQGEAAWRGWWEERLGLNRQARLEALRRKRRRRREARRAGGALSALSASFTSASSQSELDDFSSSAGWSSAASRRAWSDTEGDWDSRSEAATPSATQPNSPVRTPAGTPQSAGHRGRAGSLHLTQTQTPQASTASQRGAKRHLDDYFSSLLASQEEPSQTDLQLLEMGSDPDAPAEASSSQLLASPSLFPRRRSAAPSRAPPSQSLFPSQSSQARPGPSQSSQSSQPRKKSRMGF